MKPFKHISKLFKQWEWVYYFDVVKNEIKVLYKMTIKQDTVTIDDV